MNEVILVMHFDVNLWGKKEVWRWLWEKIGGSRVTLNGGRKSEVEEHEVFNCQLKFLDLNQVKFKCVQGMLSFVLNPSFEVGW